ncbi:MAG TPA: radical SAM protein [Candidatus Limnocylindrales bacterium]|nr:radical SAM protein [Candidatus Limnocylindrales bacterium]
MELGSLSVPEAWLPIAFSEFVIKVHSRCDLTCSYCYMYQLADRALPPGEAVMSERVFARTADRIAAHAHRHSSKVRVVLHGGEPLLAGVTRLASMATSLRSALYPTEPQISLQTNGVLLDGAGIDRLAAHGINIGLSLDGDRSANDRHRRYANGRSSFDAVDRSARLLADRPHAFAGILCVVDVRNDPLATYEALLSYRPPLLDFLLPHANWDSEPWRERPEQYGDWLVTIFDAWYSAAVRPTRVRLFEELIHLILVVRAAPSHSG